MSAVADTLQAVVGLPRRPARMLAMLFCSPGTVASDLLLREALPRRADMDAVFGEVKRVRDRLRETDAPHGIISAHGLGYRITPELRAWIDERVAA